MAALCLALCLLLPFLTGQIPTIGGMLGPMHLPVLLCGIICGWQYGLIVGAIAPFLRHLLFGMPPMPTALGMVFELAAYGLLAGVLYKLLPKKLGFTYVSLIVAMLGGRAVWGIAQIFIYMQSDSAFSWSLFMSGAFIQAWPGIILQLLLIPLIVVALKKAKLVENE